MSYVFLVTKWWLLCNRVLQSFQLQMMFLCKLHNLQFNFELIIYNVLIILLLPANYIYYCFPDINIT